jgi:hypothetical protein
MRKRCVWTTAIGVLGCTLVGVCGPRVIRAQDAVTIDVADCVKLASPGDRLNCYERHAEAAQKAAPPPSSAPQAVSPAPAGASAAPPAAVAAPAASAGAPAAAAVAVPAAVVASGAAPHTAPSAASAAPSAPSNAGATTASAGKSSESKTQPQEVVATITDLRVTVPNSYRITLDNGQVWQQTYPETYPLQTGQRVTLQGSKWGKAYRLTGEGMNGFIQVQRVR